MRIPSRAKISSIQGEFASAGVGVALFKNAFEKIGRQSTQLDHYENAVARR